MTAAAKGKGRRCALWADHRVGQSHRHEDCAQEREREKDAVRVDGETVNAEENWVHENSWQ